MKKPTLKAAFLSVIALSSTTFAGVAQAALITYSDHTTWSTAAGSITGSEDFNSFVADIALSATPTALSGGMSVSSQAAGGWNIDAAPFSNDFECDLDGTTRICGSNSNVLTFGFASGISAFGADFSSLNDLADRTVFDLYNGATLIGSLGTPQVPGQLDQFWGFVGNAGEIVTSIQTRRVGAGDTFGVDNVEIAGAAIPEPSIFALFGLGLAGLGWSRRKKA